MISGRSRVVLALGTAQTLAFASSYYLPAILAEPMAASLGVSATSVFAAFSVALVVTAILGPAVGRRIDREGGRRALCGSNVLMACGLAMMAAAEGPALLFAAWAVLGVGMAFGLYEAAFATLASLYGREARSPITGITLIAGFASTVGWPLTAWWEAELGWRVACLAWAAVHLLVALPLNLTLPRPPARSATDGARPPPPMRRSPSLAMALLAFVFAAVWFTSTAMAAHLPRLLEAAGATPAAAVAAAALVGPAQVAGRLVEFGALRRLHPLVSARLAALAHPVGAGLMLALGAPLAAGFTLLHGAGNGIMTIVRGTLPLALFGPEGYGLRQGLLAAPARLAAVAAPLSFAWLIDHLGAGALWVTAGLGLVSAAGLLLVRRESNETKPAAA